MTNVDLRKQMTKIVEKYVKGYKSDVEHDFIHLQYSVFNEFIWVVRENGTQLESYRYFIYDKTTAHTFIKYYSDMAIKVYIITLESSYGENLQGRIREMPINKFKEMINNSLDLSNAQKLEYIYVNSMDKIMCSKGVQKDEECNIENIETMMIYINVNEVGFDDTVLGKAILKCNNSKDAFEIMKEAMKNMENQYTFVIPNRLKLEEIFNEMNDNIFKKLSSSRKG